LRLLRRRRLLRASGGGGTGGQSGQELRHARIVLGDALLEPELEAGLLGHSMVELRTAIADHVADREADDEAAEDRGEAEARRDRPGCAKRAERDRADGHADRGAERDTEPAHRTRLRLVVGDELSHRHLRLSAVCTHTSFIGGANATLEELVK
jgi:hypothetical protein